MIPANESLGSHLYRNDPGFVMLSEFLTTSIFLNMAMPTTLLPLYDQDFRSTRSVPSELKCKSLEVENG